MSEPTIVTSENLAEFNASKLGLAAAPQEQVKSPEATDAALSDPDAEKSAKAAETTPDESDTKSDEESQSQKKAKPKLEKRFSELTKARDEALAQAEAEKQARIDLEAKLAEKDKPQVQTDNSKPRQSDFVSFDDYIEALADWKTEQKFVQREQEAQAREAQKAADVVRQAFHKSMQEAKAENPDFDEILARSDVTVSDEVRDAIVESGELGPKILLHLAKNPDDAAKVQGVSDRKALIALGVIAASLGKETPKVVPAVKRASSPITPLRSPAASPDLPIDEKGEFTGTYQQFKELSRAGKL